MKEKIKKDNESKSKKKKITLADVNEFFQNIFYFLRLGNDIYGKLFYKNLLYSFINRTINFSTTIFYGVFIDGLVKGSSNEYLYSILMIFLSVQFIHESYFKYFGVKMRLEEEFLSQKYDLIENKKFEEIPLNLRLNEDFKDTAKRKSTSNVVYFYKDLQELVLSLYTIVIASFAITFIDYRIIFFAVVGVAVGFIFRVQSEKKISDKNSVLNAYYNLRYALLEAFKVNKIGNIDDNVIITNNFQFVSKKLNDYYNMYRNVRYDMFNILEKDKRIAGYIFAFVTAISYFYIYNSGILKLVDLGILTIVIGSYQKLFDSVDLILSISSDFTKNYLNMCYLKKFFEYSPAIRNFQEIENIKNLEVEFKNVYFKYPSSNTYALKNINFKIQTGDILAIIGNNGAGKSTLMKLIFKIYEPTKGEIFINGINIQNVSDREYMNLFHILPQEFQLENTFTVEELIYLGNTEKRVDTKRVIWSAKNSTAHEFVKDLKYGYKQKIFTEEWIDWMNKNLKEEMVDLSAGQIRKIQVARLFYSQKPIIFMDEPTSNVDVESTFKIFDNLKKLKNNQILGFITHNLLNISLANKILIIKEGEIVEFDSKENLMKKKDSELNRQLKLLKLKE